MPRRVAAFACLLAGACAAPTVLTTFDGASATTQKWSAVNDPVMGGQSVSTLTVKDSSGHWQGEVKVVPFLRASGFCTIRTEGHAFPDISDAEGLLVTARMEVSASAQALTSFKVTMESSVRGSSKQGQFEGHFNITPGVSMTDPYFVPFASMTQSWRGQPQGGPPSKAQLKAITGLGFSQGGVAGSFAISIRSIGAGAAPAPPAPAGKNIVALAAGVPDLSTLVAAVKAAGLVDTLSGTGPFTVFAPTNEAFGKLPAGTLENLLKPENKAALAKILAYHVVSGNVQAADLKDGEMIKTVEGDDLLVHIQAGRVAIEGGSAQNVAQVIKADVEATNGVVHVIDEVLLPPAAPPAPPASSDVTIATFDGAKATTRSWREMNDPVMGGRSSGSFATEGDVGVFDGEVADVPSLKAPGFIKVDATDSRPFPDVSHCTALKLILKSSVPYAGYRVAFGNGHPLWGKFFAWGYKAHFTAPVGEFGTVTIPFTDFTDYWDDATGEPIKTCKDSKMYCPPESTLKNMKTLGFWGEGVKGKVHLEIKAVAATGCGERASDAPASHYQSMLAEAAEKIKNVFFV